MRSVIVLYLYVPKPTNEIMFKLKGLIDVTICRVLWITKFDNFHKLNKSILV